MSSHIGEYLNEHPGVAAVIYFGLGVLFGSAGVLFLQ